ncbi:hypothetical protein HanIR_Chr15g0739901 [Helianthus annuus]|nr:hypothetical protein HanIR_Chr15g0739901 [Helianthus annuus]
MFELIGVIGGFRWLKAMKFLYEHLLIFGISQQVTKRWSRMNGTLGCGEVFKTGAQTTKKPMSFVFITNRVSDCG